MEAEDDGGEVEGQKAVQQIADWVVVGCDEGVWNVDAVVPGLVPLGQGATGGGVKEVGVDVVLEYLCELAKIL